MLFCTECFKSRFQAASRTHRFFRYALEGLPRFGALVAEGAKRLKHISIVLNSQGSFARLDSAQLISKFENDFLGDFSSDAGDLGEIGAVPFAYRLDNSADVGDA